MVWDKSQTKMWEKIKNQTKRSEVQLNELLTILFEESEPTYDQPKGVENGYK